jgi:hypothetical protein
MFRWTEGSVSCNNLSIAATVSCSNLSTAVTCEHADSTSSSTYLQLMGGGREPEEPDRYSPDTPGLKVLEGLGAKAASPRVAFLGTLAPALGTTKSCCLSFYLRHSLKG